MVLINIDFWGTEDELKILDKAYKEMAKKTDGVEYLGRHVPNTTKWHYTYFFKAENMATWASGMPNFDYKRDKKLMSHGAVEFFM